MINRLLVLLQLIFIPIYFIVFSLQWRDELELFFDNLLQTIPFLKNVLPPWLIWFEIHLAIPIFFSLPWFLFSLLRATRIADSYELMGRALGRVRIDQKLFYGLNAAFFLIFLIFPFFSPMITIIGMVWVIREFMRKAILGRISKLFWLIPAIIICAIPGLVAFAFYSNYLTLFSIIFRRWTIWIPTLFAIGLSLAIAISIGNFILFLFEGSVEYGGGYEEVPYGFVLVFKTFIFGVLLIIYFNTENQNIINIANYFAATLGFIEIVMRRVKNLPTQDGLGTGIIMVIAFSVVNIIINIFRRFEILTQWIQTIVILVSGSIFFILFYLSYSYAEEEYGPYSEKTSEKDVTSDNIENDSNEEDIK